MPGKKKQTKNKSKFSPGDLCMITLFGIDWVGVIQEVSGQNAEVVLFEGYKPYKFPTKILKLVSLKNVDYETGVFTVRVENKKTDYVLSDYVATFDFLPKDETYEEHEQKLINVCGLILYSGANKR